MKKVLIAYFSATSKTEKMAAYIAEGVRFSGLEAITKPIGDIKPTEITEYDGYIIGSPTYSLGLPDEMKIFLQSLKEANVEGKMGGAFGSYAHDVGYRHDNYAPAIIFDTLQSMCKMKSFKLGSFALKEDLIETSEGMKTCQDYGRVFGEKLGG